MATILHPREFTDNANVPNSTKTAVVTFNAGPDEYSFMTDGQSVCDVARIAVERFNSQWWREWQNLVGSD